MAVLICVLIVALALLWSWFAQRSMRSAVLVPVIAAAAAFFSLGVPSPVKAQVSIGISIRVAPPALPQYYQPAATRPNMIWQPGYWGYGPSGFFWVPGTWVEAPQAGLLWTPGYWSWNNGQYSWYPGYWGQSVGYYGGINYGYGYYGSGYRGGKWSGKSFLYNTSVTHVNRSMASSNYYSDPGSYVDQNNLPRTSYNGGAHGITARPSHAQIATEHQRTFPMTAAQTAHVAVARENRGYLDSVNHGSPGQIAVPRPLSANSRPAGFSAIQPRQSAAATQMKQRSAAPEHAAAPQRHVVTAKPQRGAAQAAKPRGTPKPPDVTYWDQSDPAKADRGSR